MIVKADSVDLNHSCKAKKMISQKKKTIFWVCTVHLLAFFIIFFNIKFSNISISYMLSNEILRFLSEIEIDSTTGGH